MNRQMEEITGGEAATKAAVISDLKEKGYIIKEKITGENSIVGISLRNDEVMMEKESTEKIIYEIVYDEGKVNYFVEVEGKYHEISFESGEITVKTEESNLNETEIVKNEVIVESKDVNVVKATVSEKEEKIILESGTTGGIVEVIITEQNSKVTKTFKVIVKEPATNLTVTPTEAIVQRESTTKLTAILEPSNATDKIIWSSSNTSIATVSEDGTVTGVSKGIAIVTAKCGEFTQDVMITVEGKKLAFSELESRRVNFRRFIYKL